jgi:5-oxoprolinase (ATP-hydrolysing) subunit A
MNSHQLCIDLNADLAESVERLANGSDAELMRYITSANVACGAHAGDAVTMEQTLELAKQLGLTVGAHPSYPDRENFGRIALDMPHADLTSAIHDQLSELAAIAQRLKIPIIHVKPHGALYHACNTNAEVARAVARAVLALDSHLIMVGQGASSCLAVYRDMGLRAVAEAFADRAYEPDGALRSRKLPGSLLDDPAAAAAQAESIVVRGVVVTTSGSELPLAAETLCMHSDTPGAAAIARSVRECLTAAGVQIRPLV